MNKHNKYKKQYEKDQQTIKSFNQLYKKSLQDNGIDKIEYESPVIFSVGMLMKRQMNFF